MKRAVSDRGLWFEDCSPVQYPRKCWKAMENDKSAPELPGSGKLAASSPGGRKNEIYRFVEVHLVLLISD